MSTSRKGWNRFVWTCLLVFLVLFYGITFAYAAAESWIFSSSTYTHDPDSGERVSQYRKPTFVSSPDDPLFVHGRNGGGQYRGYIYVYPYGFEYGYGRGYRRGCDPPYYYNPYLYPYQYPSYPYYYGNPSYPYRR